jgi:hypothetical protein
MLTVNSGMLGSVAIPGFSVAVRAIFDEKEHVKVLQDIFTSV